MEKINMKTKFFEYFLVKMFKLIKRFYAHWYKIPKYKVPIEIRKELYNKKYVINKNKTREYKRIIIYKEKKRWVQDHDIWSHETVKSWKENKFYYRKLK